MVHLYIGKGKGKTSAALGLALRAAGWKKRVYFAQFLKDPAFPSGEITALKALTGFVTIERFHGQIHPIFQQKKRIGRKQIRDSVTAAFLKVEGYLDEQIYDVIILDEILNALEGGYLAKFLIKRVMRKCRGERELVLTGRSAPEDLISTADYVSVIQHLKHPFDKGVAARKSVEY
jgi:cob(I)alamin adenosyltransferase